MSKNLILVFARGGSKKTLHLNLRLINDKPLFYFILKSALDSNIADVYVSSDSQIINELAVKYGAKFIPRPKSLIDDNTPFGKIASQSLKYLSNKGIEYEKCLILTPVFPLISKFTIKKFFNNLNNKINTIIGFSDDSQRYGLFSRTNKKLPLISKNDNQIVKTNKIIAFNCKTFSSYVFQKPFYGISIPKIESITVIDYHDLSRIETILSQKRILVRVDGHRTIGLGHVYNVLTILNHLRENQIIIVMNKRKNLGDVLLKLQGYNVKYFTNNDEFFEIVNNFQPNIIINDILNTSKNYVQKLTKSSFVINFEDEGNGKNYANLVFNPIFSNKKNNTKIFYGHKYACVRDDFRYWGISVPKKKLEKILITFGGTDSSNITTKILKVIQDLPLKDIKIIVILGIGYSEPKKIKSQISTMNSMGFHIEVIINSQLMTKHISESDFVISSNGRTVFEIGSLGVPMITISVTPREEFHPFSKETGGGIHLGYHKKLSKIELSNSIMKMMNYNTRKKYFENLRKLDLLTNINTVIDIINSEYDKENKIR